MQTLRRCGPLSLLDHVVDRGGEIVHPGARYDDRVAAAMRFLRDPEKFTAVIFAEFHMEMFAFDLQFPGLYEVIHFLKKLRSLGKLGRKREADFWAKKAPL